MVDWYFIGAEFDATEVLTYFDYLKLQVAISALAFVATYII